MENIFVINLKKDIQRKEYIKKHFSSRGLDFEFIEGVYGKELSNAEISKLADLPKSAKKMGKQISLNEIGCALSHQKVYKKIIDENLDGAFIFEDDVVLSKDIKNIAEAISRNKLPKESWLGLSDSYINTNKKLLNLFNEYKLYKSPKVKLAIAYYIDYAGAKKLLELNTKISYVADWFISGYINRLNIYSINIACVMPNSSLESSIDETRVASAIRPKLIYRLVYGLKRIYTYKFSILKPLGFYKKVKYSNDLSQLIKK